MELSWNIREDVAKFAHPFFNPLIDNNKKGVSKIMALLKRTPLYSIYGEYGGKVVDYAGWELPVQFEGITIEHEAVRNTAGLFDVSHMGEIEIRGEEALKLVQKLITNDASSLKKNTVIYTFMCYETGGVVDDLLVYKMEEDYYYLVVNASNVDKDYEWICKNKGDFNVEIINISNEVSELALQGPKSEKILQKLTSYDLSSIKFFCFSRDVEINGVKCLISRTGYTGEDGFEIYSDGKHIEKLWREILKAGEEEGIKPAGLGCRDTLRFEASLPLYGNEISKDISPIEAGFGYFVKEKEEYFIGKEVLLKEKKEGPSRKLIGFQLVDRGIPRHGYKVFSKEYEIGFVTTGYFSPTLKKNIGLALVESRYSVLGEEILIEIRNKKVRGIIINKKFYKRK